MTGGYSWPYPRWVAHRGAGKLAPENTLAAFRLGASHGYRMFECDAKLSSDGVVFLMHDAQLDRTTNGKGTGGALTWAELSRLDAGSWHSGPYAGEPLPTLEGVARYCLANDYFLNIEIKPTPGVEEQTGVVVAQEARRLWAGAAVAPLLTSFQPDSLKGAMKAVPELPRGLLLDKAEEGWLDFARSIECKAVVWNHKQLTAELISAVKGAGMKCLVYTVNDGATAQRLRELGVDAVITDSVDLLSPT